MGPQSPHCDEVRAFPQGRPVHRLQVLVSRQYWKNLGSPSPGNGSRSVAWNEQLAAMEGCEVTAVGRGMPRARSVKSVKIRWGMETGEVTKVDPRGMIVGAGPGWWRLERKCDEILEKL